MTTACPFCGRCTTYKGRKACYRCLPRLLAALRALTACLPPLSAFRIRDESHECPDCLAQRTGPQDQAERSFCRKHVEDEVVSG